MPGAKENGTPDVGNRLKEFFERHKILSKLKDLVKKGLGIAKEAAITTGTAVVGAGIRIAGGQKAFNDWAERRNAEADREEIRRANEKTIGSKVACPDGKVFVEGTIKSISQDKNRTEYTIELITGKTVKMDMNGVMTLEEFHLKNRNRPQDLKMTLIDKKSLDDYKKSQEEKQQEKPKQEDKEEKNGPEPSPEETKPPEPQFNVGDKYYEQNIRLDFTGTKACKIGYDELTISGTKIVNNELFYDVTRPNGRKFSIAEKDLSEQLESNNRYYQSEKDFDEIISQIEKGSGDSLRVDVIYTQEHPEGIDVTEFIRQCKEKDSQEKSEESKDAQEVDEPEKETEESEKDAPEEAEVGETEKEEVPQEMEGEAPEAPEAEAFEAEAPTAEEEIEMFDFPEDNVIELTEAETAEMEAMERESTARFEEEIRRMTEAPQVENSEFYEVGQEKADVSTPKAPEVAPQSETAYAQEAAAAEQKSNTMFNDKASAQKDTPSVSSNFENSTRGTKIGLDNDRQESYKAAPQRASHYKDSVEPKEATALEKKAPPSEDRLDSAAKAFDSKAETTEKKIEPPVNQKEVEVTGPSLQTQAAAFDIPKNVDVGREGTNFHVSNHVLYAFKGKYQEAEITAINKKSIELKLNNGRECSVKKADAKEALFGYEDIKHNKVMNQCVNDKSNSKFSDMFRQVYQEKTEQIHEKESDIGNKEDSFGLDDLGDLYEDSPAVEAKSFKELAAEAMEASRNDFMPQNSYQSQNRDSSELGLDI